MLTMNELGGFTWILMTISKHFFKDSELEETAKNPQINPISNDDENVNTKISKHSFPIFTV